VSIHTDDFEEFNAQEGMHIVIEVQDFRAIVTHAETLRTSICAHFSFPTRPLQFAYQALGMHCEFTLMTTGDYREASSTANPRPVINRSSTRQPSVALMPAASRSTSGMPPPARPSANKPLFSQSQRTSLKERVCQPSAAESDPDPESLFMPGGDADRRWDPASYDNDEAEEMLGWDANNQRMDASFHSSVRDTGTTAQPPRYQHAEPDDQQGLEPTQRLSQVSRLVYVEVEERGLGDKLT